MKGWDGVGGKGGFQIYTLGLDVGLQQKECLFVGLFVCLLVELIGLETEVQGGVASFSFTREYEQCLQDLIFSVAFLLQFFSSDSCVSG